MISLDNANPDQTTPRTCLHGRVIGVEGHFNLVGAIAFIKLLLITFRFIFWLEKGLWSVKKRATNDLGENERQP